MLSPDYSCEVNVKFTTTQRDRLSDAGLETVANMLLGRCLDASSGLATAVAPFQKFFIGLARWGH